MQMFGEKKILQLLISIRDKYKIDDISTVKLRLIGRRMNNDHEYELPMSRDIGGLIVEDIGASERSPDIIIICKFSGLQRVTKLHLYSIRFFFLMEKMYT